MISKKRIFSIVFVTFVAFFVVFSSDFVFAKAKNSPRISEYCLVPKPVTRGGIGDRLNILSDLIHNKVAFNRKNFISESRNHGNMGLEWFFDALPAKSEGKKHITYSIYYEGKSGFYKNTLRRNWNYANEHDDEIYKLLNIEKKKKEVLKKYKVPKNYFDNSMSLHIRCGDTKNSRVEPFEKYYNAVKYINEKTGSDKVICFYENDDFSVKTATEIIDRLKKEFPKIKFEKCMSVKTDAEELLMMSMCKHNIQSYSYFVKWATNFNTNPNKVIFKMHYHKNQWVDYNGHGFCDYKESESRT